MLIYHSFFIPNQILEGEPGYLRSLTKIFITILVCCSPRWDNISKWNIFRWSCQETLEQAQLATCRQGVLRDWEFCFTPKAKIYVDHHVQDVACIHKDVISFLKVKEKPKLVHYRGHWYHTSSYGSVQQLISSRSTYREYCVWNKSQGGSILSPKDLFHTVFSALLVPRVSISLHCT